MPALCFLPYDCLLRRAFQLDRMAYSPLSTDSFITLRIYLFHRVKVQPVSFKLVALVSNQLYFKYLKFVYVPSHELLKYRKQ